jgi:hypothetical protein
MAQDAVRYVEKLLAVDNSSAGKEVKGIESTKILECEDSMVFVALLVF